MKDARVAIRYAKSLLSIAIKQNSIEEVKTDMALLASVCKKNRDFENLLKSPVVKSGMKNIVLNKIFDKKLSPISMKFIGLITDKKRESFLASIAESFIKLYNKEKNIVLAVVTTAVDITEDVNILVLSQLKKIIGDANVEIEKHLDPTIIGGFILKVGDQEYNASASNKLHKLKREFVSNPYIKKY